MERLSGELGARVTKQEQLQGEANALRRQLEEAQKELAEAEEKVYSSIGDYKVSDSWPNTAGRSAASASYGGNWPRPGYTLHSWMGTTR